METWPTTTTPRRSVSGRRDTREQKGITHRAFRRALTLDGVRREGGVAPHRAAVRLALGRDARADEVGRPRLREDDLGGGRLLLDVLARAVEGAAGACGGSMSGGGAKKTDAVNAGTSKCDTRRGSTPARGAARVPHRIRSPSNPAACPSSRCRFRVPWCRSETARVEHDGAPSPSAGRVRERLFCARSSFCGARRARLTCQLASVSNW